MKNQKHRLYFAASNLLLILLLVSGCSMNQQKSAPYETQASGQSINQLMQLPNAETVPPQEPAQAQMQIINPNARYKIALLVPLSGKSASIGKQLVDASQMAVLDSGDKDYQIIPYDTAATSEGAAAAADLAISQHVNIILGPVFSGDVLPVAVRAKAANLKVISFSNNKAVASGNVYILGPVPEQQVSRVIKYAGQHGVKGLSGFLPGNAFGTQLAATMNKLAAATGGSVVKAETYSIDYDSAARELSAAFAQKSVTLDKRSQGILIPEGGDKLPAILTSLDKVGISSNSIRLLGTAFWDREEIISNPMADGAWFASTPYEDQDSFNTRFNRNYNYKPDDIGSLGYDGATLAMDIITNKMSDADLKRRSGFNGVKGVYRFGSDNVDIRNYAIYEITGGRAHVIDPAADRF